MDIMEPADSLGNVFAGLSKRTAADLGIERETQ